CPPAAAAPARAAAARPGPTGADPRSRSRPAAGGLPRVSTRPVPSEEVLRLDFRPYSALGLGQVPPYRLDVDRLACADLARLAHINVLQDLPTACDEFFVREALGAAVADRDTNLHRRLRPERRNQRPHPRRQQRRVTGHRLLASLR